MIEQFDTLGIVIRKLLEFQWRFVVCVMNCRVYRFNHRACIVREVRGGSGQVRRRGAPEILLAFEESGREHPSEASQKFVLDQERLIES